MGEQGMGERGLRSVFIGNIPYEVSEERLKEIFGQVGPVLSMKLVFDRDSGKPKGYGFCEYQDAETAMSAMRNLNGVEVNGRNLRVDNAGAQSHRMAEMGGGVIHNNGPSGPHEGHFPMQREREIDGPPPPERVPEIISKTVASLAPEQMFDLMKQMKQCIQNNPNEARTMLVQNPQLAYALLQAQVVMKMIDPQQALSMLHKDNAVPVGQILQEGAVGGMAMGGMGGPRPAFSNVPPPATDNPWLAAERAQPVMPMNPPGPFGPGVGMGMGNQSALGGDMDFRQIDPRLRNQGNPGQGNMPQDLDLRDPRAGGGDRYQMDPRQQSRDRDFREMRERDRDRDMRSDRDRDLRDRNPERHQRDSDLRDPRSSTQMSGSGDPRMSNPQIPLDPRARARAERDKAPTQQQQQQQQQVMAQQMSSGIMAGFGAGMADSDKAALIMQVLQLSDEQIAMLPAEQRQSIVALKEQIAKTTR